jgi:hypothetical protein
MMIIPLLMGCTFASKLQPVLTTSSNLTRNFNIAQISVTDLNLFEDHYGGQHIVGEVHNESGSPLQSILLEIHVSDTHGHSILKNAKGAVIRHDLFQPFLKILFPGDSSGFEYTVPAINGTVAQYEVKVSSAKAIVSQKANVQIEHAAIRKSLYGTSFIVGELINYENFPVKIQGLDAAVIGQRGELLNANKANSQLFYLSAANDVNHMDRGAFAIPLRGSFDENSQWRTYLTAVLTESLKPASVSLSQTNQYADALGNFHLVGYLKNTGNLRSSILMLASLYGKDGTVLDSVYCSIPYDIGSGENFPFDLSYWNMMNDNPTLQSDFGHATLLVDPSQVIASDLSFTEVTPQKIGNTIMDRGIWKFSGSVQNPSNRPLKQIVVIISITDSTDNLIASNFQVVSNFEQPIAPQEIEPFEIQINLDPNLDVSSLTFQIRAVGEFLP